MGKPDKHLLVVGGPTAAGKTAWAIRLARHYGTAILSADSRQCYRALRIGTARPTADELAQAPHHFVGHLGLEADYSVGDFEREALARLEELFREHNVVVLTGGSGLYLKALCEGLDAFPEVPLAVREAVQRRYEEGGLSALQEQLQRVDPAYYAEVDRQNPARLLRALAVWEATGRPFSSFRRQQPAPRPFSPIYLQLSWPRARLYRRIDERVDRMLAAGLVDEARALYPYRGHTSLQTVGYQELFEHFEGKITLEEAVRLIKRNSRRYAKRQLTWMRRDHHWKHLGPDDWPLALDYIEWARRSGQRIGQAPGDALEVPGSNPDRYACRRRDEEILAAVPLFFHRDEALVDASGLSADPQPSRPDELLLHEAVYCAEDRACYVAAPPSFRGFLNNLGFEPVETISAWLAEQLPDRGANKPWILMRLAQPRTGGG